MKVTRRRTMLYAGASLAALSFGGVSAAESFEIIRSEAEWRRRLNADEYAVLREEATEKRHSSLLLEENRAGLYHCKGCDLAVYSSGHKYNSGTGWPSFWRALPEAIGTKEDNSFFSTRTEVHCRRCGSHFGHIFDDGPPPTGKRHCLNGLALSFAPQAA